MPDPYEFWLLSAFVWRLATLLVGEQGPPIHKDAEGNQHYLFEWLRYKAGVRYVEGEEEAEGWSTILTCVWCMSMWLGLLIAALWLLFPFLRLGMLMLSLPFAISAVTVLFSGIAHNGKS